MNAQPLLELVVSSNGFGFRSDTGEVYRLNATACQVLGWMRECDEESSIVKRIAETFSVAAPRARSDLSAFLEHLQTLNLLKTNAS